MSEKENRSVEATAAICGRLNIPCQIHVRHIKVILYANSIFHQTLNKFDLGQAFEMDVVSHSWLLTFLVAFSFLLFVNLLLHNAIDRFYIPGIPSISRQLSELLTVDQKEKCIYCILYMVHCTRHYNRQTDRNNWWRNNIFP